MKILACLCLLFAPGLAHAQYSYVEAYRKAVADLSEGNAGEGLKYARLSDSLRPNHPQIMYLLAVAYIENKDPKDAIHVLRKRATFYALTDFEDDPAFNTLREHSDYAELLKEIGIWNEPQQQSKFAFRIQAEGLHAEGITYDPKRNLFWVGDVRSGQVLACGTKGGV